MAQMAVVMNIDKCIGLPHLRSCGLVVSGGDRPYRGDRP